MEWFQFGYKTTEKIYPGPLDLIQLELLISTSENNKTEAFAYCNIFIKSTKIGFELIPTLKNHIWQYLSEYVKISRIACSDFGLVPK